MKYVLILFASSVLNAQTINQVNPDQASCLIAINSTVTDLGQSPSVFIGSDYKTQVIDPKKVVERKINNNSETIRITQPEFKLGEKVYPQESKITITRKSDGTISSVVRENDQRNFQEIKKQIEKAGQREVVFEKSVSKEFSYSGKKCETTEVLNVMIEKDKEVRRVTYDKNYCDKLNPILKSIGSTNAIQCGNLILSAQQAYLQRNEELKKQNKQLSFPGLSDDQKSNQATAGSNFAFSNAVQACIMVESQANYINGMGLGGYGAQPQQKAAPKKQQPQI